MEYVALTSTNAPTGASPFSTSWLGSVGHLALGIAGDRYQVPAISLGQALVSPGGPWRVFRRRATTLLITTGSLIFGGSP
jgi:hypothetical protein